MGAGIDIAPVSPARLAWRRFLLNRIGVWSLGLFAFLSVVALLAPVLCTARPLVVRYDGQWYWPLVRDYPETTFGGDFLTETDYNDPLIRHKLAERGNFAVYAPDPFGFATIDMEATRPNPAPPSSRHWLGTDAQGRDVLARLVWGFRVSVMFAFALTVSGTVLGMAIGAFQGYFGGKIDLALQRVIEVWGSLPDLYLLIIAASLFAPTLPLLLVLLSMFGWMGLSDYVRAEFLRNRQMDYVRAARALGASHWQIVVRHILPNSLTPVVTFLPFRMSGAVLALTSLDFLGLGVPPPTPSLGEMLAEAKSNLDAWWLSGSVFVALVVTLLLLTFIGEALRGALDPRHDHG